MNTYSFEKLTVWQNARELSLQIYQITSTFPKEEIFGLTSQIRRAGISISCNIAEGTSRWSNKEKIRFLEIAYGSLMEVLNCTIMSFDLKFIGEQVYISIREKIDEISNKINGLKKSFSIPDNTNKP